MAQPLPATELMAALRAEGVHVAEHPGWRTHHRNHKGPWSDLNGIVIHHTAGRDSLGLCWSGTRDLPGPLCHTHLAKNGTATMVGYGRANHAGTFARNAHDAVVAESATHPRPDAAEPVDGNAHYYGIEIENRGDGDDPYPAAQYEAAVRWAAALCRAHGWSAHSVIGHKEGTRRKIDPSFPMGGFRAAVAERLKHPASWSPGSSTPNPPKQEDNTMALSTTDIAAIARGVWSHPVDDALRTSAGTIRVEQQLWGLAARTARLEQQLAAQTTTITALADALKTRDEAVDVDALVARIRSEIERVAVRLDVAEQEA